MNPMTLAESTSRLYANRFTGAERKNKALLWKHLCVYLQRYIPADSAVLDMGAGFCEFINQIEAKEKIAVDGNADTRIYANPGVRVLESSVTRVEALEDNRVDRIFLSNLLEHLADKEEVLRVLGEAYRLLRPGGKFILIQPNIRFCYREYWDYFDHHVPLTERSLGEGLKLAGFQPEIVVPAFLPFTTQSRWPKPGWLLWVYLRMPFLWRLFGQQCLIVAAKPM